MLNINTKITFQTISYSLNSFIMSRICILFKFISYVICYVSVDGNSSHIKCQLNYALFKFGTKEDWIENLSISDGSRLIKAIYAVILTSF